MHTHDSKGTCNLEKTLVRSHSLLKLAATDLSSLKELVSILNHLYITLYRRTTAQDKILVVRPPPPSALHHLQYLLFMYCKGQTAGPGRKPLESRLLHNSINCSENFCMWHKTVYLVCSANETQVVCLQKFLDNIPPKRIGDSSVALPPAQDILQ